MKLLITGCAGFIGANFAEYILNNYNQDSIVGVDCLTYAANSNVLSELVKHPNFTFYKQDICDIVAMESVFSKERPDVVVNFAAESHVDRSIENSEVFLRTNVIGTGVLLDMAKKYSVKRFHQVSTDEVYGDLPIDSDFRFNENSPLNPSSPYSSSKASADLLALSYMKTHNLPVSISRSSNNYGKYQHTEKFIPMIINRIRSDKPITVYGDGTNMRDWLFVLDNCRAIDLIIRAGKCEVYNIGADNQISNIDLVNKIISLAERPDAEIEFVTDRKCHDRKYAVNIDKISSLGWKPEANFETELKNTVKWYINQH